MVNSKPATAIALAIWLIIIGYPFWFCFSGHSLIAVNKTPAVPDEPAITLQSSSYKVYKPDGSIITLTPSPQHPLIFFATWCSHCQKELANDINPNAYYIDTFTKERTVKDSYKAVQAFIKTYHTDSNLNQYFVSVDEQPQGVPYVPYTLNK